MRDPILKQSHAKRNEYNMIIVLANEYDNGAKQLVEYFNATIGTKLLTPRSLASNGWYSEFNFENSQNTFMIDNQEYNLDKIDCILTLTQFVTKDELLFIQEEDRVYIAQEMTAFLLGWLYKLNNIVINKPTAASLLGISWRQSRWLLEISKFDIKVKARYYDSLNQLNVPFSRKTEKAYMVSDNFFGFPNNLFIKKIKKFTKKYNILLLTVEYIYNKEGTPVVYAAYPLVDTSKSYIKNALVDLCTKYTK